MAADDDKTQQVTVFSKGTVVGHYRIIEKIDYAGVGEVYSISNTEYCKEYRHGIRS